MAQMMTTWSPRDALADADDDAQLLRELLDIWFRQAPEITKELRSGVERCDLPGLRDVTHLLHSSLGILHAERAAELAERVEASARCGDVAVVPEQVADLLQALDALRSELTEYLESTSSA